jgi:hypothetical protein
MTQRFLGEFEQMVLLSILQLKNDAYAVAVLEELDSRAGRHVSRGSLYKTLRGITVLQESRHALTRVWEGLDSVLEGEGS